MHYYTFNIADYRKDTQHLSPMEHYIYRSLLDWCYLDEEGIPKEKQKVIRRLQLNSDQGHLLENVLSDFFTETETCYQHNRVEREIDTYKEKLKSLSENGRKGGRPKKQGSKPDKKPNENQLLLFDNQNESKQKPNQEPITKNQEPITRPWQALQTLYNEILGESLGKAKSISDERKRHIRARVGEDPKRQQLGWWEQYFQVVSHSEFLTGRGPPNPNTGKSFRADLDWLVNQNNMVKILEGKYDNR